MNKVILVDDHYIVRQGLRFLLSTIENIEVLQDFADGETLFVSEKTIKTHVSHIFSKLQVSDRTQAAIYAMENKLI
ncbi:TPA: hypothetical protein PEQ31_002441 [Staphylococcus aureus]|nr:hypothetical protein [Staphylococcus aureus]